MRNDGAAVKDESGLLGELYAAHVACDAGKLQNDQLGIETTVFHPV